MKSDIPLDYAVFQLSPRRSRCELFVSYHGTTEKLASGLVKPFVTHLRVAEEQVALAVQSIKLEAERQKHSETWFTKGTLERFVRFVSTPEVLELVNTFDAEMSQLEAARRIYSQGVGESGSGRDGAGATAASDATKKELLRAIDVRLAAVRQDLVTACRRASSAGFNPNTVSELQFFAEKFGAHRLSEACRKFISLCQGRPDLINSTYKSGSGPVDDKTLRSSSGSDMSLEEPAADDFDSPQIRSQEQQPIDQSKASSCQTVNSKPYLSHRSSRESSVESDSNSNSKEKNDERGDKLPSKIESAEPPSIKSGPFARQLSVQDRINLFENKQKEVSSSGSGGKPIAVGKSAELRRLPSDAAEKSVLRRWSGASDMSIDVSGEKKELPDSTASTPTSAYVLPKPVLSSSSGVSKDKEKMGLIDSAKPEIRSVEGSQSSEGGVKDQGGLKKEEVGAKPVKTKFGGQVAVFPAVSEDSAVLESKSASSSGRLENVGWRDQVCGSLRSRGSFGKLEDFGSENLATPQPQSKYLSEKTKQFGTSDQAASMEKVKVSSAGEGGAWLSEHISSGLQVKEHGDSKRKDHVAGKGQSGVIEGTYGDGFSNKGSYQVDEEEEDAILRERQGPRSQFRSFQRSMLDVSSESGDSQDRSQPMCQNQGIEFDGATAHSKWRSFSGEVKEVERKDFESSGKQTDRYSVDEEDFGAVPVRIPRQSSGPEHARKSRGRRDISGSVSGSSQPGLTGKDASANQGGNFYPPAAQVEQAQRARLSKGNQELNDELKMKANELEKLFAEHKLRVPGDQPSSPRRSRPAILQEPEVSSVCEKPRPASEISPSTLTAKGTLNEPSGGSSNFDKSDFTPPFKTLDTQDYDATPEQNSYSLSFSDDSRGKLYGRYMQKRNAKLKEEWSSSRAVKEARMKFLQDSLEKSRAEMKANLTNSAERRGLSTDPHLRAEKLRSFSARSARKKQPIHSFVSDEDEEQVEFPGQKTYSRDAASRNAPSRRVLPNVSMTSSTPRTAAPIPRSSVKASALSAGRRKLQSENTLAQSVPNFSEFRKENAKPSSGGSKATNRAQARNTSRSRNGGEDMLALKDEKSWRLRKSSSNPMELNDLSALTLDCDVMMPSESDKEETELYGDLSRNRVANSSIRKGNAHTTDSFILRSKAIITSDTLRNEDDEMMDVVKDEEDFESMVDDVHCSMDNCKPKMSQESDKSANSGFEDGDDLRCVTQADPTSVSELPATMPPVFRAVGSVQDSPGESPGYWNPRMHNSFSFPHEISDIDASIDSPLGSPAYWNSHSLTQGDSEAARMRKKWGAAQKPMVVSDSSHGQSRKDMAKGLKRFLKFGRKNRGVDLADWVSATTSEGDDDTEDGRDPTFRSSEDLRKSRMGFSHGNPSDDAFSETDLFNEQGFQSSIPTPPANFKLRDDHLSGSSLKAPRSFFSLSNFRSKGSDSKPR